MPRLVDIQDLPPRTEAWENLGRAKKAASALILYTAINITAAEVLNSAIYWLPSLLGSQSPDNKTLISEYYSIVPLQLTILATCMLARRFIRDIPVCIYFIPFAIQYHLTTD